MRKLRWAAKGRGKTGRIIRASKDTLESWEQGRRRPRGPAKALLRVFEEDPKAVIRALG